MNGLRKMIMYFTLQEREKRVYESFEKESRFLVALSEEQLYAKYVKVKSVYEFKKTVLTFFMVTLFLSTVTGLWQMFYELLQNSMHIFLNGTHSAEEAQTVIVVSVILFSAILIFLIIFIVLYLKGMHRTYEQLLHVEYVLAKKKT